MCRIGWTYLEGDLSMAVGGIIVPIHIQGADDIDPGGIHGHQDHALLLVGGGRGVSLTHEDGNLAAWVWRPTRPPLLSTHYVAVAVPARSVSVL